jgi:hypothetical protein
MSLPGFMKHLRALEDADLLRRKKTGRVVTCTLVAEPMRDAGRWREVRSVLEQPARLRWRYLYHQEETKPWPKSSKKTTPSRSSRKFSVGPAKVWRALTDPEALKQWMAPSDGYVVRVEECDVAWAAAIAS